MTRRGGGRQAYGMSIAVVAVLIAPLVAAGVWVFAVSSESPLESASAVEPLIASVEPATRSGDADVAVTVVPGTAFVPVTQASGTVTTFNVEPGAGVANLDVVMTVDAQSVIAYTSDQPLYRDVTRKSTGADVKTAQQLLKDLGFLDAKVDGKAGYTTELAIKAFNAKYGYGAKNTVLSRASLVWIGADAVTAGEVKVAAGDTVLANSELFSTTSAVAAISVTESPGIPPQGDLELVVGDFATPYVLGSQEVSDADAVASIVQALGAVTESTATIRLVRPTTVGTVPSSAIVEDSVGASCMFGSVEGAPIAIAATGGTLGTVDLDASLIGDPVLVNPRDVREDLSCGS